MSRNIINKIFFVIYRFGETEGSYCTLATFSEKENHFLTSTSSESPTSDRSVSPASDISSGSVEMPSTHHNSIIQNHNKLITTNNIHMDMKKVTNPIGTPKKYRNNKNHSISPIVGYNNHYSTHHNKINNYAPNNLVQQRHLGGNNGGNRNTMSQQQSTWRTNYYEILPHFALNNSTNGGSYNNTSSNGYNNYNRPTYPRMSQFQNVLTV